MNFKQILIVSLTFGFALQPVLAMADDSKSLSGFCADLDSNAAKLQIRLQEKKDELNEARIERQANLQTARDRRDELLQNQRSKSDKERLQYLNQLKNKAKTTEQKLALKEFEATVNNLVLDRRQSIDKIRVQFMAELDQIFLEYKTLSDQNIQNFEAALNLSLSKARNDCAANKKDSKVTFLQNSKNDQNKFSQNQSHTNAIEQKLKQLTVNREKAINQIETDFKTAAAKATAKLQTFFR